MFKNFNDSKEENVVRMLETDLPIGESLRAYTYGKISRYQAMLVGLTENYIILINTGRVMGQKNSPAIVLPRHAIKDIKWRKAWARLHIYFAKDKIQLALNSHWRENAKRISDNYHANPPLESNIPLDPDDILALGKQLEFVKTARIEANKLPDIEENREIKEYFGTRVLSIRLASLFFLIDFLITIGFWALNFRYMDSDVIESMIYISISYSLVLFYLFTLHRYGRIAAIVVATYLGLLSLINITDGQYIEVGLSVFFSIGVILMLAGNPKKIRMWIGAGLSAVSNLGWGIILILSFLYPLTS